MMYPMFPLLHDYENWYETKAKLGYTQAVKHVTGVTTMVNTDRADMGQHTIYSGKSLQRIEEMNGDNGIDVLKHHISNGHTLARIDIALDFINQGITVSDFEKAFTDGKCETRLKTASTVKSLTHAGHTFYIGSTKARKKLIRVYDKAAEQGIPNADWIRVELQLMGKPATKAGIELVSGDPKAVLLGVLKSVVHFPTLKTWCDALADISKVKIGTQSSEKGDTRRWLEQQAIPALVKEIIMDEDYWITFSNEVFARLSYEKNEKRKAKRDARLYGGNV